MEVPDDLAMRFKAKEDHTIRSLKKKSWHLQRGGQTTKWNDPDAKLEHFKFEREEYKRGIKLLISEKIEETMKKIGASVKEAIVNKVATSTNKIEDQIKTSYANAISRSGEISSVELKSVVTEARFALKSEKEKFTLLGNLFALKRRVQQNKHHKRFDAERTQYKLLSEEAKHKNNQLSHEDSFIWRVRGNSKNGYRLVRQNKHGKVWTKANLEK